MSSEKVRPKLTEEKLQVIIERYSGEDLVSSRAYGDCGAEPLWPRFERAVSNQMYDGKATISRYAIWADSVRDNLHYALEMIEKGNTQEAQRSIVHAANNLSAFSDVQAYFDPLEIGRLGD